MIYHIPYEALSNYKQYLGSLPFSDNVDLSNEYVYANLLRDTYLPDTLNSEQYVIEDSYLTPEGRCFYITIEDTLCNE